ncbi:MAG TPA: TatD family hydrolase [Chthoniobacteraceae bacterium]|nr:TatD family hydrolase [Chthoniobacteraceae bacterium]
MLTDTHAHLDFPQIQADFDGVLARANAAQITRIVTIGTSVERSRRALQFAEENPHIFAVAGVHPNNVAEEPAGYVEALRELARNPRVVAIGETGLDYHYLPSTRDGSAEDDAENKRLQADFFRAQLSLAAELQLSVVIHERDAWEDTVTILREYTGRVRAVFHCFGKSPTHAQEVFDLGHLVSFTGIVTFKNAEAAQQTAATCPADRYMVETDCPYLAPIPHRGKSCEPAYVRHTAEFIAKLRGISLEEVAAETERTANGFYRFHTP